MVTVGGKKLYSSYVKQLVESGDLPGAVLYVSQNKNVKCFQAFGSYMDQSHLKQPIYQHTLFDVASLTKVMATLPSVLYLVSKNELNLTDSIQTYLPDFKYPHISIEQLLLHTSGLQADLPFVDRLQERDVLKEIYATNLVYTPGEKTVYSDLGMILLGKVVEKVAGEPLDTFVKRHIFNPWGLGQTTYLLPRELKGLAASTEKYNDHFIQGEVHDEKAFQLGGVSGSAGLFSTVMDIATFSNYWLYPEEQEVIPAKFLHQAVIHRQHNRGLGFEVWSGIGESLSCGDKWAVRSFGHTGFTGTSLWIDPIEKLIVVFLTNAVHFGRNTNIKGIRKQLHSLIYSSLIEEINT